jgi:hypothetical protein
MGQAKRIEQERGRLEAEAQHNEEIAADEGEHAADNEFSWNSDSVVMKTTAGIAVYTNPHGDVVVRQEKVEDGFWDQDPFIVIPRDRVRDVIAALEKEIND